MIPPVRQILGMPVPAGVAGRAVPGHPVADRFDEHRSAPRADVGGRIVSHRVHGQDVVAVDVLAAEAVRVNWANVAPGFEAVIELRVAGDTELDQIVRIARFPRSSGS